MKIHFSGGSGLAVVLLVLFVPAIVMAYLLHSAVWLVVIPFGVIVLALVVAVLPLERFRRKVTPEQFADELERHLLGTAGPWDWDDIMSIAIANERLRRLQSVLSKYDSLR